MSWIIVRLLIFLAVGLLIYFGLRRIWRDWTGKFRADDQADAQARLNRDRAERTRPDVITLERGKDGTFRPPGDDRP